MNRTPARQFSTGSRSSDFFDAFHRVARSADESVPFRQLVALAILSPAPQCYISYHTARHKLPALKRMSPSRLRSLGNGRWLYILSRVMEMRQATGLSESHCLSHVLTEPAPRFFISLDTALRIIYNRLKLNPV